jgi:hypothetical protein
VLRRVGFEFASAVVADSAPALREEPYRLADEHFRELVRR